MIRYKVKNCIDEDKDVILEIEEEFTNTLLNGLNISVTDFENGSLITNISLSYFEVLELYKMLTEKICNTQMQTLDIMKSKQNKYILEGNKLKYYCKKCGTDVKLTGLVCFSNPQKYQHTCECGEVYFLDMEF